MNQKEFIHTRLNSYSSTSEPLVIDGKSYKTVKIGNQTWMAEDLQYNDGGSGIIKDPKYGNLCYDWDAANRIANSINGWKLPSKYAVEKLVKYLGGLSNACDSLRSESGWDKDRNGNNKSGFNSFPSRRAYPFGSGIVFDNTFDGLRLTDADYWTGTLDSYAKKYGSLEAYTLNLNCRFPSDPEARISIFPRPTQECYQIRLIKE